MLDYFKVGLRNKSIELRGALQKFENPEAWILHFGFLSNQWGCHILARFRSVFLRCLYILGELPQLDARMEQETTEKAMRPESLQCIPNRRYARSARKDT
jgi:hypothetical protein